MATEILLFWSVHFIRTLYQGDMATTEYNCNTDLLITNGDTLSPAHNGGLHVARRHLTTKRLKKLARQAEVASSSSIEDSALLLSFHQFLYSTKT